jgi:murein DD-endopeptidase MepM/ murein hydrolase activator NlpD
MPEYIYPTAVHSVSDSFADHKARGSVNPGTDYTAGYGSPVYAVKAGTVRAADSRNTGSGGRLIYIDHPEGDGTDYLHLSRVDVHVGQHVEQGQQIGLSGASGYGQDWYYGPHLHISLHVGATGAHGYNGGCIDFDTVVNLTDTHGGGAANLAPSPKIRKKDTEMMIYSSTSEHGRCYLVTPYAVTPVDDPNYAKQLALILTGSEQAPKVNGDQINILSRVTNAARTQLAAALASTK